MVCTNQRSISAEQSPPSEAYSRLACREILGLLWSPNIQYHVHKNSLQVPVSIPIFPKIYFKIILLSLQDLPSFNSNTRTKNQQQVTL